MARVGAPFPLVVLSPGAAGSGSNYGWLGEYLARSGFVVAGVSHYGESLRYGPETLDPSADTRLWSRPTDCTLAITEMLEHEAFQGAVDPTRIAAVGHSSGGAAAVALGGAVFDPAAMGNYCQSALARNDRWCQYGQAGGRDRPVAPEASQSYRNARVKAIVMLDPAVGPGYTPESLATVRVPVLVVGCRDNDFLLFTTACRALRRVAAERVTY